MTPKKFNTAMKVFLSLVAIAALATPSYGRLGETIKETGKRYGAPVFTLSKDVLTYESYRFKEKKIEVIFSEKEAIFEVITFGPTQIRGSAHAKRIGKENGEFIQALLSSAYGFSNEDVAKLIGSLAPSGNHISSQIKVGDITVAYSINALKIQHQNVYQADLMISGPKFADQARMKSAELLRDAQKAQAQKATQRKIDGF